MKRRSITLTFVEFQGVAHLRAGRQKVALCGLLTGKRGADARALVCESCMRALRERAAGGSDGT